jgi:hypothetical protein
MKKHLLTSALAVALCLPAAPLFAQGVLVVQKTTIGTTNGTSRAQIEKDRMRTEINGVNGEQQVVIFDGVKLSLTTIYVDRKAYTVATKADMDAMRGQVAAAQARQQEMIARMPPAQRAQMEAMMKGRGRGAAGATAAAAPKTQFHKTGTDKVGTWTCDKYEGVLNGQKVSELCTVDPRALGFVPADFEIAKKLAEFNGTASPQAFAPGSLEVEGYVGVPVKRVEYTNGQPRFSFELVQVTRQSFPASSYEVPAGFQKMGSAVEAMRGRARGTP